MFLDEQNISLNSFFTISAMYFYQKIDFKHINYTLLFASLCLDVNFYPITGITISKFKFWIYYFIFPLRVSIYRIYGILN